MTTAKIKAYKIAMQKWAKAEMQNDAFNQHPRPTLAQFGLDAELDNWAVQLINDNLRREFPGVEI